MAIANGSKAPDFTLVDTDMKPRAVKEFSGKNVILVFYPGAFTGVCTKELCTFRDAMTNFNAMNAQVVGVSVDGPFANKAFANANGLTFPLLSDYTASVSKMFGGVHEDFAGMKGYTASKRAVFILDKTGTVKYAWVSDNPGVEPLYDEINKVLSSL
jgi:glutaredoxin-dependent peroxiredoxin